MGCRMNLKIVLGVTLTGLILSGCTPRIEYIVQPVDRPPSLTSEQLPTELELECLTDSSYGKVVGMHLRILTLEDIIDSTQE